MDAECFSAEDGVTPQHATEGNRTPGIFRVSRSGDTSQAVTFDITYGGTASSNDYLPPPNTVTLPANANSQAVDIQPVDDTSDEATETIEATLSTTSMPAGYAISMSSATINLLDNDEPFIPTISVQASDGSASEQVNPSTGAGPYQAAQFAAAELASAERCLSTRTQ